MMDELRALVEAASGRKDDDMLPVLVLCDWLEEKDLFTTQAATLREYTGAMQKAKPNGMTWSINSIAIDYELTHLRTEVGLPNRGRPAAPVSDE